MITTTVAANKLAYTMRTRNLRILGPAEIHRAEEGEIFKTTYEGYKALAIRQGQGYAYLYYHKEDNKAYAFIDSGVDNTAMQKLVAAC
jgi:hypothetical protein